MARILEPFQDKKRYIPVNLFEGEKINVPVYPTSKLGKLQCSAYVRLAAEELFGKRFAKCHAWNRQYNDWVVATLDENTTLKSLVKEGVLERGMALGVHNPLSSFRNWIDQEGNLANYTHAAMYIGRNRKGQPLVAEQFTNAIIVRTEDEMRESGLTPIHIFDSRE